jgi:tRNA A37 threonylcarbamoyladenosine dehydratase
MGAGAKTDPTQVEIRDIAASHHCPLAHMLRKRLHKWGIRTGFHAVFSPEPIREGAMIIAEETNKKSNVGTISYMPAVFGCACASVVIRGLIGEMTAE